MADDNDEMVEAVNPLDLPDDELDAALEAAMLTDDDSDAPVGDEERPFVTPDEGDDDTEENLPDEKTSEKEEKEEDNAEEDEADEDTSDTGTDAESADDTDTSDGDDSTNTDDVDEDSKAKPKESEDDTESEAEAEKVNFEALYKQITAPFKANGHDIQIDNPKDAIALMQMGANYNKKMAGLKPNLKLLKMLENHELLDADKLTHLIDLSKKDPAAIRKLIKDSGINPLDIDLEKGEEYTPKSYTVDDSDVELDGILDDIRETDSFKTTIDIVGNKWDDSSKKVLLGEPEILRVINDHVASGVYKQIKTEVDKQRMLGNLNGLSDLAAYQTVGSEINERGGFNSNEAETESTSKEPKVLTRAKKSDDSKQLKSRKKAASSTKSTTKTKKKTDFDPLNMSDEDFEKVSSSEFI